MQPAIEEQTSFSQREQPSRTKRRKKRMPLSFLLAGIAVLGAIIYLVAINTQSSAAYDMTVTELHNCTSCSMESIRVTGTVQAGSVVRDVANEQLTFVIFDGKNALPVTYSGVVPDIFKAGIQVVVEGKYTGHGAFKALTLLTKCPSKFQSATPATK